MALFTKKEDKKELEIPPKRFSLSKKSVLAAFLSSVLELGDKEDYEYLSKTAAKMFFSQNSVYLNSMLLKSNDEMDAFIEFLNYFLNLYGLGDMKISINEASKELKIYHYNSPFLSIYEEDYFLKEFYRLLMGMILEKDVTIQRKVENEVQIFIVS
jgi:hypothetical protein